MRREREKVIEILFSETMAEKFPNPEKERDFQIKKIQTVLKRWAPKDPDQQT